MDRKTQMIALVATVGIFFGMMALAAWWSMRQQSATSGGTGRMHFTAQPGTTRDNARILTTNKRDSGDRAFSGGGGSGSSRSNNADSTPEERDAPPELTVDSLSAAEDRAADSPFAETVCAALNAASPEVGIAKLGVALDTPHTAEESARIYTALAVLYGQLEPPDYDRAKQAFERALAVAPDAAARRGVVRQHAAFALGAGFPEEALPKVEAALQETNTQTEAVPLLLLLGQIREASAELEAAETLYRKAVDHALESEGELAAAVEESLRLAALRLARLYSANGREEDAEALRDRVAERLGLKTARERR